MNDTMKTLTAGMKLTVAGFRKAYELETIRNMWTGEEGEVAYTRAKLHGHPLAWCINAGSVLVGDRTEGQRLLAKAAKDLAEAVTVVNGEKVMVDGEVLTVKVNGERFSDCITLQ